MTPNPFSAQVYKVFALMALHNFIHQEAIIDNLFIEYDIKGAIRDDESDYDDGDAIVKEKNAKLEWNRTNPHGIDPLYFSCCLNRVSKHAL